MDTSEFLKVIQDPESSIVEETILRHINGCRDAKTLAVFNHRIERIADSALIWRHVKDNIEKNCSGDYCCDITDGQLAEAARIYFQGDQSKAQIIFDRASYVFSMLRHYMENNSLDKGNSGGVVQNDTYKYDPSRIGTIFTFCCNSNVFRGVDAHEFGEYVAKADFAALYNKKGTIRSKLKRTINKLSYILNNADWYRQAAQSISATPSDCSGANVSEDWLRRLNALK